MLLSFIAICKKSRVGLLDGGLDFGRKSVPLRFVNKRSIRSLKFMVSVSMNGRRDLK